MLLVKVREFTDRSAMSMERTKEVMQRFADRGLIVSSYERTVEGSKKRKVRRLASIKGEINHEDIFERYVTDNYSDHEHFDTLVPKREKYASESTSMIRRIRAENFMAYRDVEVEFDETDQIVNITGDNGAGKSSFLEVIPFAVFGVSRVNFDGLLKHGASRMTAEVEIHNDGMPPITITRTRNQGEGSSKVRVDVDEEDGTVVYRNKEATDFIQDHFGMDYFLFSLISYFGLGSGDQIVSAPTKTRITYLQRIANISLYLDLAKRASRAHKVQMSKMKAVVSAIKELKFLFEAEYDGLEDKIDELTEENRKLGIKRDKLMGLRARAGSERDRIYHLSAEKKKLRSELKMMANEVAEMQRQVFAAREKVNEMRSQKKITMRETFKVRKFLEKYPDGLEKLDRKIGELVNVLELVSMGLHNYEDGGGCPLCGAEVGEELVEEWKEDMETYGESLGKHSTFRETVRSDSETAKNIRHAYNDAKNYADHLSLELQTLSTDFESKKRRVKKIETEVNRYYEETRIDDIEKEINEINNQMVDNNAHIGLSRKKVRKREEWNSRMEDHKSEKSKVGLRMDVCDSLSNIFSQKGIPLQLLRDLCAEIEVEATDIFRQFDHGEVLIRGLDEEDGKPDVSFHLETQSGIQGYSQLSAGQRTLLLLCVRLALSNICFRNHTNTQLLDFIVLDEITTHLSENKIDSLTRVLSTMLKSTFSQMFVISHTSIANLQPDVTLNASMRLGDSEMEVV